MTVGRLSRHTELRTRRNGACAYLSGVFALRESTSIDSVLRLVSDSELEKELASMKEGLLAVDCQWTMVN